MSYSVRESLMAIHLGMLQACDGRLVVRAESGPKRQTHPSDLEVGLLVSAAMSYLLGPLNDRTRQTDLTLFEQDRNTSDSSAVVWLVFPDRLGGFAGDCWRGFVNSFEGLCKTSLADKVTVINEGVVRGGMHLPTGYAA